MALKNELVPHEKGWSSKFADESKLLEGVFGEAVVAVHHVGSTAIPGIYAKPEVDIHVELAATTDIDRYSEGMASLGYRVRGEEVESGSHYYSKDEHGIRTFKVHASETGHPSLMNQLKFRDYLREHPARAHQCSELKRRLAAGNSTGIMECLNGKRPFNMETLALASPTAGLRRVSRDVIHPIGWNQRDRHGKVKIELHPSTTEDTLVSAHWIYQDQGMEGAIRIRLIQTGADRWTIVAFLHEA